MDALLLFGRRPQAGKVKTRLAGRLGAPAALDIYRALLADAFSAGAEGPFVSRRFYCTGEDDGSVPLPARWQALPQVEGDLGARLQAGVHEAFAAGAKTVTLYGADHPRLGRGGIFSLWQWADQGHIAILPTTDGGYAGLSLPEEIPGLFENISWSTPQVLAQTRAVLEALKYPHKILPPVEDIDTAADWLALYANPAGVGAATRAVMAEELPSSPADPPVISVIVPVRNEAAQLSELLPHLKAIGADEVIVVDGESSDNTVAHCKASGMRVLESPRGRARQTNAGAVEATGDVLLFLHADSRLPPGWRAAVERSIRDNPAGRFDVVVKSTTAVYPALSFWINFHSRLKGIATGDQTIFITRRRFQEIGGFPEQPLMEDIELCKRLKRNGGRRLAALPLVVTTSARRWESRGFWSTVFLMWELRIRYWLGDSPEALAERYRY